LFLQYLAGLYFIEAGLPFLNEAGLVHLGVVDGLELQVAAVDLVDLVDDHLSEDVALAFTAPSLLTHNTQRHRRPPLPHSQRSDGFSGVDLGTGRPGFVGGADHTGVVLLVVEIKNFVAAAEQPLFIAFLDLLSLLAEVQRNYLRQLLLLRPVLQKLLLQVELGKHQLAETIKFGSQTLEGNPKDLNAEGGDSFLSQFHIVLVADDDGDDDELKTLLLHLLILLDLEVPPGLGQFGGGDVDHVQDVQQVLGHFLDYLLGFADLLLPAGKRQRFAVVKLNFNLAQEICNFLYIPPITVNLSLLIILIKSAMESEIPVSPQYTSIVFIIKTKLLLTSLRKSCMCLRMDYS
jgi:hypothetical protein